MTLPITGNASLVLAVVFGFIFGLLLQLLRPGICDTQKLSECWNS